MYLPLILLDRYGWWGFLAFAIPNVLGCAAFGYVIKTRDQSRDLVREHGGAMRWFSVVTIAYHLFFLGYLWRFFVPSSLEWGGQVFEKEAISGLIYYFPTGLLLGAWGLSYLPTKLWPWLAAAVYAVSLGAFALIGVEPLGNIEWAGSEPLSSLGWMAPMLCLGFLASPYLDLTFHRARQEAPSPHAFGVFGITFAVMILLSCAYAAHDFWGGSNMMLKIAVGVHVLIQMGFTVAAHLREMRLTRAGGYSGGWLMMFAPLLVLPLAPLWGAGEETLELAREESRDMYLRFLALYGLAFPVYVVLRMGSRGIIKKNRGTLMGMIAMMAVFLGMGEFGFFRGMPWLLVIPVVVMLGLMRLRGKAAK